MSAPTSNAEIATTALLSADLCVLGRLPGRALAKANGPGIFAPCECGPLSRLANSRLVNPIARLRNSMPRALRLNVAAMLPCSGRSFAMRALQKELPRSHALRSSSAGRYLLPIDTKAGFCPNRIDSAKWRRLSHAFDASGQRPSRTTRTCDGGGQSSGRSDRAQGVTAPECAFSIPAHFKELCEAATRSRTSVRSLGTGSEGRHGRRAAARGGTNGDS
jgi:hypothetical protein